MAFITVYSKRTGRQQRIPEHWLDNPVLGQPFRKTPPPQPKTATVHEGEAVADRKSATSKTRRKSTRGTRGAGRQRAGKTDNPATGDQE